jgi:hypothetical protein
MTGNDHNLIVGKTICAKSTAWSFFCSGVGWCDFTQFLKNGSARGRSVPISAVAVKSELLANNWVLVQMRQPQVGYALQPESTS